MQTLITRISKLAFIVYAGLSLTAFAVTVSALMAVTGAPVA
jgi:hypothetical protein